MSIERIVQDLEAFVRRVVDPARLALWPGMNRGATTNAADFAPEGELVPGNDAMPLRVGLPGVTLELADGLRAMVGYEGGDLSRPYVTHWEPGGVPKRVRLRAQLLELQGGDAAPDANVATVQGVANLLYQVLSLAGASLTPPLTPSQVLAAITGGAQLAATTPPPAAITAAIEAALDSQTPPGIGAAQVRTG